MSLGVRVVWPNRFKFQQAQRGSLDRVRGPLSPIDISPVADLHHKNHPHVILKFAKYPKIADPVPPEFTQLATKRFSELARIFSVSYPRIKEVQNPATRVRVPACEGLSGLVVKSYSPSSLLTSSPVKLLPGFLAASAAR